MINTLALTASPAPEGSAPPTLREIWDAAAYGVTWFFTNLSPAFAWAVIGTACAPGPTAWNGSPWRRSAPSPGA